MSSDPDMSSSEYILRDIKLSIYAIKQIDSSTPPSENVSLIQREKYAGQRRTGSVGYRGGEVGELDYFLRIEQAGSRFCNPSENGGKNFAD